MFLSIFLLVYMDDLIIICIDMDCSQQFITKLASRFFITDLGICFISLVLRSSPLLMMFCFPSTNTSIIFRRKHKWPINSQCIPVKYLYIMMAPPSLMHSLSIHYRCLAIHVLMKPDVAFVVNKFFSIHALSNH